MQETYTVLKEIYDVPDLLFHKRMDFLNEVLDLKEFIKDPVRTLSLGQRIDVYKRQIMHFKRKEANSWIWSN